jgi:hypothetical protein
MKRPVRFAAKQNPHRPEPRPGARSARRGRWCRDGSADRWLDQENAFMGPTRLLLWLALSHQPPRKAPPRRRLPELALPGLMSVTVSGSTLSGNSAGISGGGIYNSGDIYHLGTVNVLDHSTICGNSAPSGADLYNVGVFTKDDSSTICVIGP